MSSEISLEISRGPTKPVGDFDPNNSPPYLATWTQQFRALLWRSWHSIVKEPLVVKIKIVEVLVREEGELRKSANVK